MNNLIIPVKGQATITLRDSRGCIKSRWTQENLIVTAGLEHIASRMVDATDNVMSHMAVGSSDTTPALNQTALQGTEHERVSATISRSGATFTAEATFGSGIASDVNVAEFGIFNAATSGDMLARFISSNFTLPSSDTVDITWSITIGKD